MKILISEGSGFCFGVKRAIQAAFDTAGKEKEGVYTLGPIIHNPQVVARLEEQGVRVLENPGDRDDVRVLIIRSHGVGPDVYKSASERGITVVDATCPFVKTAQSHAETLTREGYQVVIVGDRAHPEVRGILGYAGPDAIVFGKEDDATRFSIKRKVGIISQTTQSFKMLQRVIEEVLPYAGEVRIFNTICNATRKRQQETGKLAESVDVMLVVGGKNSANTRRLQSLCEARGVPTYHIETARELEPGWFTKAETVGITGGASTPDWIIQEIAERLREL